MPTTKVAQPDPVDWKKALKKLADALDNYTEHINSNEFCFPFCPALEICESDHNSDANRCRRVITKWARENF